MNVHTLRSMLLASGISLFVASLWVLSLDRSWLGIIASLAFMVGSGCNMGYLFTNRVRHETP